MEKPYHIVGKEESQELAKFLVKNGQALLPMVELIEQSKLAVDELVDVLGRAQIEAVLRLSAQGIAGPPHPGKKGGAIGWHGGEEATVCLKERKPCQGDLGRESSTCYPARQDWTSLRTGSTPDLYSSFGERRI